MKKLNSNNAIHANALQNAIQNDANLTRTENGAVTYCSSGSAMSYNECANTDIEAVFELILNAAVNNHVPQSELLETIYIISDMEFDCCTENADLTNFKNAKQMFHNAGYELPHLVFWNVQSRHLQQPVGMNDRGVTIVSGCSPSTFELVVNGTTPYEFMMMVLNSERYAGICA